MTNIIQQFLANSAKQLDSIALYCGIQTITYRELLANIGHVAQRLNAYADQLGNSLHVGILAYNSIEQVEIFWAAVAGNHLPYIYNPDWKSSQVKEVLALKEPDILFISADLYEQCKEVIAVKKIILVAEDDATSTLETYDRWQKSSGTDEVIDPIDAKDDALFVSFTSGTTATPKGFIQTKQAWAASFNASAREFNTARNELAIAPGPLAHGLSFYAVIEALTYGVSVQIFSRFNIEDLCLALEQRQSYCLVAVPTMLRKLCAIETKTQVYTAAKTIITAGDKLDTETAANIVQLFPNAEIYEYYGASELGFISIRNVRNKTMPLASVGRPFFGVQVSIKDGQHNTLEPGKIGQIWVKSKFTMRGYLNIQTVSSYSLKDEWSTIGDLGFIDNQGYIHIKGRCDDMIKSGGYNIFPAEIEAMLKSIPGIKDCYVFGLADAYFGAVVCAALVIEENVWFEAATLKQLCLANMLYYKCPKVFYKLSKPPLTSSGKVSRTAIKNLVSQGDQNLVVIN